MIIVKLKRYTVPHKCTECKFSEFVRQEGYNRYYLCGIESRLCPREVATKTRFITAKHPNWCPIIEIDDGILERKP